VEVAARCGSAAAPTREGFGEAATGSAMMTCPGGDGAGCQAAGSQGSTSQRGIAPYPSRKAAMQVRWLRTHQ
jgi:hypothetical protein